MLDYDVELCHNAACFSEKLQQQSYDLVMLDLNLPDADGLEVLQRLRKSHQSLVYVISGRTDQDSRIQAFELGADDFISKPFSIREVELKIRNALLRSTNASLTEAADSDSQDHLITVFDVTLDLNAREMYRDGFSPVALTRGESELLACLIRAKGAVVNRKQLISVLSTSFNIFSEESITTLVYRLRKKFLLLKTNCPISTAAGEGYRLERRR